jgi:peptide/nickel transport system ATP-binding protein
MASPLDTVSALPLLRVENAVKRFVVRRRSLRRVMMTALDGVDLTVDEGETVGIVGESGSGKSTLGRAILHLLRLDGGRILFEGREIQGLDERAFRPLRAHLQMVFQNPLASFNPTMTIGDALIDAMRLLDRRGAREKRRRAIRLLAEVQLDERFATLFPYEMSGGQLQRVALARALAPEPRLIFLDEPTAALDMSIRGQIINLLLKLQRDTGLGFVFVSHDLRIIRYVADRVVVMYLGQIVESAAKTELFSAPRHPYTRALLAATRLGGAGGRVALRGEALGLQGEGRGCRLAPRCPHVLKRCHDEPQSLFEIAPGHSVRCWRAAELAADIPGGRVPVAARAYRSESPNL